MATVLDALEIERLETSEAVYRELPLPLSEYPESSAGKLVSAARRGESAAWETLVRTYHKTVYDTVRRRVKTDADADEVCQEVFLQAVRKLNQLKDAAAIGSWLRRIAERLAINYVTRNHTVRCFSEEACDDRRDSRNEPFTEAVRREAQAAVWQGLEKLGQMDREALFAFYIEGKSLNEMSREFAVPLGTVKRRLHVARKRLAEQLAGLID